MNNILGNNSICEYKDLAMAIANYVYKNWNRPEELLDGTSIILVDNMCSTGYQICTEILTNLGILEPIDDLKRRNKFLIGPADFEKKIISSIDNGPSYEALILGLINIVKLNEAYDKTEIIECLIALNLCNFKGDNDKNKITWTEKINYYENLFERLPELMAPKFNTY